VTTIYKPSLLYLGFLTLPLFFSLSLFLSLLFFHLSPHSAYNMPIQLHYIRRDLDWDLILYFRSRVCLLDFSFYRPRPRRRPWHWVSRPISEDLHKLVVRAIDTRYLNLQITNRLLISTASTSDLDLYGPRCAVLVLASSSFVVLQRNRLFVGVNVT